MAAPVVPQLLHSAAGCVVVHKPPGVPFHATANHPGLLHLIRSQQGTEHLPYTGPLYPVHRLDNICSGALVLATSSEAAGELVSAFRSRQVRKYYVALSDRRPAKKMGTVSGDMQKGRRGSWMLARTTQRPAVTRFTSCACEGAAGGVQAVGGELLVAAAAGEGEEQEEEAQEQPEREEQQDVGQQQRQQLEQEELEQQQRAHSGRQQSAALRAFLLKPETGKTHQLRVAMKSLGAPVLGDERYALKTAAATEDRGYLHCAALRFTLRGQPIQVVTAPQHGRHFTAPPFQQLFTEAWFPPGLAEDTGVWFADSKLLRSELASGAAAEPALVDW